MNIFEKAIEIIQRDGWLQGDFCEAGHPRTGAVCTVGAINRAYTGNALKYGAMGAYTAMEIYAEDHGFFSIAEMNDCPTTTVEDMILGLKWCAAREDEK